MESISKESLKTYEVCIGDCSLKLKSQQNPDTVNKIVQVVENQLRCSKKYNQNLSMQKAFVLSCLNMAEELVCLKQALKRQMNLMESSVQSIFSELNSSSKSISK